MTELIQIPIIKVTLGYIIIILFAIFPILISITVNCFGNCLGCNINEAGTDDCVRFGIPFGKILNPLVVIGWLFLITIPIAFILSLIWSFLSYKILTQ